LESLALIAERRKSPYLNRFKVFKGRYNKFLVGQFIHYAWQGTVKYTSGANTLFTANEGSQKKMAHCSNLSLLKDFQQELWRRQLQLVQDIVLSYFKIIRFTVGEIIIREHVDLVFRIWFAQMSLGLLNHLVFSNQFLLEQLTLVPLAHLISFLYGVLIVLANWDILKNLRRFISQFCLVDKLTLKHVLQI